MKQYFFNLCLLSISVVLLFSSCDKTISSDEPFPDERVSTVFITPNNNKLLGYSTETGGKLWEFTLDGNSIGSPVILHDRLYVVTDKRKLYSYDLKTKEFIRSVTIPSGSDYALAAGVDDVYIAGNTLMSYDSTGTQVWQYNGGSNCTSAPEVVGDRIYVACGTAVHCVNTGGNNVWTGPAIASGSIFSSVNVADGVVYYGAEDNKMYAIDANNGASIWSYTTNGQVNSSPMVYGGMCIAGSDDNNIYCVEVLPGSGGTGQLRWQLPTAERVRSSATVHAATNTVLIGCHDFNLYAIDHVSGTLKWKYAAGSIINSSPTVVGNKAYFASYDKYLYCIDARFGNLLWKTNMDYLCEASPVVDDGTNEHYSGLSGLSTY